MEEAERRDLTASVDWSPSRSSRRPIKPNLNEVKKLGKPSDIIKLVFDLVGLLKMEKMVKTEPADWHASSSREAVPRASARKNGPSASSRFSKHARAACSPTPVLKNIFYFSKYEKDMINDETIEFMH